MLGIARHGRPRGPIELLDRASVSVEAGIAGDYRGAVKPGGRGRRQLTLMEADDWLAAVKQVGVTIEWQERRVNLLVGALNLPQRAGARLRIGEAVQVEITGECDPCRRMDEIAPGLRAALTPDWRGGVLSRVLAGGEIRVGDRIIVEELS
nr:MOSC domain-containing protein [Sphingomonas jejuensis]